MSAPLDEFEVRPGASVQDRLAAHVRGASPPTPLQAVGGSVADRLAAHIKSPEQLGGLDPGYLEFGPEGPKDSGLNAGSRFLMSFAQTQGERRRIFEAFAPDGSDLKRLNDGREVFKYPDMERWDVVDPSSPWDLVGDVADWGSDALKMAAEGYLMKRLPLPTVGQRVAVPPLGAAAVEGASQILQSAAGVQDQGWVAQLTGPAMEWGFGAAFGGVGEGIGTAFRVAAGRAGPSDQIFEPRMGAPEGEAAQQALRERARYGADAPPTGLTISQAARLPLVQKMGKQANRLFGSLTKWRADQFKLVSDALEAAVDPRRAKEAAARLQVAMDRETDDVTAVVLRTLRDARPAEGEAAGLMLKEVIETWWKKSGEELDILYAEARQAVPDNAHFDYRPVQRVISEAKERNIRGFRTVERVDENKKIYTELELVESPNLDSALVAQINPILKLDGIQGPVEIDGVLIDPLDALRNARRIISQLSVPDPMMGPRIDTATAAKIANAIDAALQSPVDARGNPLGNSMTRPFIDATQAAATRFKTRELLHNALIMKSETPGQLAEEFFGKRGKGAIANIDKFRALKLATSPEDFERVKDAMKIKLLDNGPFGIGESIERMGDDLFNELFTFNERRSIREAARKVEVWKTAQVPELLGKQKQALELALDVIQPGQGQVKAQALRRIISNHGGRDGELGRTIRAAISEVIIRESRRLSPDEFDSVVRRQALDRVIKGAKKSGAWWILSGPERETLENSVEFLRFVDSAADSGVSLQTAEFSSQAITALGSLTEMASVVGELGQVALVGRALQNDQFRRIVTGLEKETREEIPKSVYWALYGQIFGVAAKDAMTPMSDDKERELNALQKY